MVRALPQTNIFFPTSFRNFQPMTASVRRHIPHSIRSCSIAPSCCCCWWWWWWGIVRPLDELVAQSRTNNLDRSQNSKNPDPRKLFLWPTRSEETTKKDLNCKFKIQGVPSQKVLLNRKYRALPNCVGQISLYLRFEVIYRSNKSRTQIV